MTDVAVDQTVRTDPGPAVDLPAVPVVRKRRSLLVYLSVLWLVVLIAAALLAAVLPLAPFATPVAAPRLGPQFGSVELLLGTDTLGRSMLSRIIYGARVSLVVGTVAGLVGFVIGSLIGLFAGYFGKRLDAGVSLVADAMLAFPPLILLLALASILEPSVPTILLGLTLLVIPAFIRLSRANTMSWSSREFVRAARNIGAGNFRILFREILPNLLAPLAAYLPIVMAALIVAEGSLSFLGLGIPPPQPSWGGMINDGKDAIATSPHLVFVPALVIFFTVFALNQVGDHLRTKFDRTMHD
ncbi:MULTISPECIES: ABC transporter permease [Rhodococcus]|uniref:ABC transporter permease n=1 Tax=Rhodococcus oxybenzonivorans TaxID=1990687 RepID=A0AAE4V7F7_9NOCA|nr:MULTISPECIES: ABC transporter permease [Rhodococcus]MDV7240941.1 ABC transporter permease [Rhodococcus oxybenzonivorans]MDV7268979.1 ABC transporter permease [Rhodococcus oxybenzonivorans]MDV7273214.1 ABC transporter permease [Rhodococcus oxybenzonivorans]MDV7333048.1 ABC transporter permease [Rhodococcus oxybenzonivorans]MDV7342214.1 ABC transporter permease [Rhodococcus oxybenzonivorans]